MLENDSSNFGKKISITCYLYISVNHHLEYSRAAYSRLRMNVSASNSAAFKVVGLKLAKCGSVKIWGFE